MIDLRPVDAVEIISLVDNLIERPGPTPKRPDVVGFRDWTPIPDKALSPRAEHGLSMLVRVHADSQPHTVLFDTAGEPGSVVENAERIGLDLTPVEAIILSHQHWDHTRGLVSVLKALNAKDFPLIVHPYTFVKHELRDPSNPDFRPVYNPPAPTRQEAVAAGARIIEAAGPHLLCGDTILVTGEVPRVTEFEVGTPMEWLFQEGEWQPDPRVLDDRSIVMNVRGKGLVVVSGCAHAGIINTVRYAQELTGVEHVAAIIGGFHLIGANAERAIAGTVEALREIQPDLLVPSHCTGWRGRLALAQAFPQAFVPGMIGNMYRIGG